MARFKTKRDLVTLLNKVDLLEAITHEIQKTTSSLTKKSELSKFIQLASGYVAEERNVILIAVKLR